MIEFKYLTGCGNLLTKPNVLSFLNEISDELSFYGSSQSRHDTDILADFDASIAVTGEKPSELPALCKELQTMGLPLPPKKILRTWNELIFNLYPADSIIEVLTAGEIRGAGLVCEAGQQLYGGHLMVNRLGVRLSVSLTSIEVQSQLLQDISLGLQALLAIISNLADADLILGAWGLTLRPGMLYEEIFNGTKEGIDESGK